MATRDDVIGKVLTGIPRKETMSTAEGDKIRWIHKYVSDNIKVTTCFTKQKKNYCSGSNCILIDDNLQTTLDWNKQGGIGFYFDGNFTKLRNLIKAILESK